MVSTNGVGQTELTVNDHDEHLADKNIKQQVLKLRSVIDDDERRLFVDRRRNDPEYSWPQAEQDWGVSIRQYLRSIKRLWPDDADVPVQGKDYYWEQVPLSQDERLYPPDTNGYRFSLVEHRDSFTTDRELREAIGVGARGDIPEPQLVSFKGLSSVLNRNRIDHTWAITTDRQGPPPSHNTETVSVSMPIPKHILENAVEAADNFLQQAGLGFDVKMPDYMGGEEAGI